MKTAKRFGRGDSRKRFSHRKVDKGGFEIWHLEKFFEKKSNVTDFAQTYLIFCVSLPLRKKLYGKMKTAKRFGRGDSRKKAQKAQKLKSSKAARLF